MRRQQQPTLPPAPPNPREVDWVYVGRLVGVLTGPITRRPTEAEARAAVRGENGITVQQLANRAHVSHETATRLTGGEGA